MRTFEEITQILELHEQGFNKSEIARITGIPRCTCRDIIRRPQLRDKGFNFDLLDKRSYAFLLGEYLGDGHISLTKSLKNGRNIYRIRIFQDLRYPNIISQICSAIEKVFHIKSNVYKMKNANACIIYGYSSYLYEMFPQHGEKRKHLREIKLTEWQKEIIEEFPFEFLKGMIYSDGCIFWCKKLNQYVFEFTNQSEDIKRIYEEVVGHLGITCSRNRMGKNVRITNKLAVAVLLEKIPLKS